MTREEAIEYLEKLYMMADITDEYGYMDDTEPYETAIDMAVEALKDVPDTNAGNMIYRQDAIDAMYQLEVEDIEMYGCSIPEGFDSKPAIEALKNLPSTKPERKIGKWIDIDSETYTWKIRCSECGHERSMMSTQWAYPNYCENCRAKMEVEE